MSLTEKNHAGDLRELGLKLANFRRKLAYAIGQKKITQGEFGEMFGGYSGRAIASYELGDSTIPAVFFYLLWKNGNSIDAIFAEGPVSENGKRIAVGLFDSTIEKDLLVMDDFQQDRLEKELNDKLQIDPHKEKAPASPVRRKAVTSQARKHKKRR